MAPQPYTAACTSYSHCVAAALIVGLGGTGLIIYVATRLLVPKQCIPRLFMAQKGDGGLRRMHQPAAQGLFRYEAPLPPHAQVMNQCAPTVDGCMHACQSSLL